jgi:putative nucleotidyltransferase with HDIG domain
MTTVAEDIIKRVESFPAMSSAAVKVLSLLDDPDYDPIKVENALRQDPSLTANILRLSNSAYFGLSSKVGSIRQALVLLGWKRLSQLVLTSCVTAIMNKEVPGYDLPPGDLWRHSIAVSVAAEGLVSELKLKAGDEIFTAALLHDLGKLVLGAFVKEQLVKIEEAAATGLAFEEAEMLVLGTDHAEIGARILERWSLPQSIVRAVRWHSDPDKSTVADVMVDTVHVANVLCSMMGIGIGREGLRHKPSPSATRRLGVSVPALERVASRALQWANELAQLS